MNKSKGAYLRQGLPAKLMCHLEANPGKELTRAKIATMFNTTPANVSMAFKKLEDEGWVESVNVIRQCRTGWPDRSSF